MKNIVTALLIFLILSNGCQTPVEYSEVEMDHPIVVCPDSELWNYSDLEDHLLNTYEKYHWVKKIYIDDTLSVMRINLNVIFKHDHYGWDSKILAVDIMKSLAEIESYCSIDIPSREKCLVSINYNNVRSLKNSAQTWVKIPLHEFEHYNNPLYEDFKNYIFGQMTPADFQAYDRAFKVLYAKNKDERLETNFYKLIMKLSEDDELSNDEDFVLNALTDWALTKPQTETHKHFDYFRNQILEASKKADN